MTGRTPRKVAAMLEDIDAAADKNDPVSVRDLVEQIGPRAFGTLIAVPALLGASPLGAVPTVPSILALTVAILAAQVALGRNHLWLPDVLGDRSISSDRVHKANKRLQPYAERLDRWFHARLKKLSGDTATRIASGCCLLLCLTVPPLEVIPFAAALPLGAIGIFGIALALRDGLLMLFAYLLMAAALLTATFLLL